VKFMLRTLGASRLNVSTCAIRVAQLMQFGLHN
jgi:hypothetical protein